MNLTDFINNKIKIGVSEYDYFEIRKTNPTEYEKLSGLELQYLKNGYVIYKEKNMDSDYKIHTYIFSGNDLSLLITNHCDTKEKQYSFYTNSKVSKTVTYLFDTKYSHMEFDRKGEKSVRVEFPQSISEKLSGYKYENGVKISMGLRELEKYL